MTNNENNGKIDKMGNDKQPKKPRMNINQIRPNKHQLKTNIY